MVEQHLTKAAVSVPTKEAGELVERLRLQVRVGYSINDADALCKEAAALIRSQAEEISRCHARLEIECYFDSEGNPLPISMAERPTAIDGIEARDCTIKLQDEQIARLTERAERAEAILKDRAEIAHLRIRAIKAEVDLENTNTLLKYAEAACVERVGEIVRLRHALRTISTYDDDHMGFDAQIFARAALSDSGDSNE